MLRVTQTPSNGLYLLACTNLPVAAATLVSPLVMTFLLTAGSGTALLERHLADRPGYAAYQARTGAFIPRPPRRRTPAGSSRGRSGRAPGRS
jgi:steroid 5-alpha reductase family enzyme